MGNQRGKQKTGSFATTQGGEYRHILKKITNYILPHYSLYESYGDNYKVKFDISIEFNLQPLEILDLKKFILFGRHEE